MMPEPELSAFSLEGLAHRCRRETERFFQRGSSDDRYCFALFRQAIAGRSTRAWELVFDQYAPLVTGWIARHPAFAGAEEERAYFVNRAFERMWQAMTPEKFGRMANLKALIAYLKLCVHAAIIEHVERRTNPQEWSEADMAGDINRRTAGREPAEIVQGELHALTVWEAVSAALKSEAEQVIARCSFVYDMKPAEIAADYPDLFPDVRAVYRQKENLLSRLSRDPQLLAIWQENA